MMEGATDTPTIRVLLVEDSPTDVLLLREALRQSEAPFELTHVSRVSEAVAALAEQHFSAALLDLGLPDEQGLAVVQRVRQQDRRVPIVVLTALDDEQTALQAVEQGAQDYLVKGKADGQTVVRAIRYSIQRQRAEQLEHDKLAAEEANRAKDHFLAVLSHELRTPLAPVLAAADLLQMDPGLNAESREAAAMIRRNVALEARLIDDLLDLTRIARGKISLEFARTDVHRKLAQTIENCASELKEKRLTLTKRFDAAQPHVQADAARLQQVFWNVLRNSIKFTPVGGAIEVRTANPDPGVVRVEISDNGIGIEPDLLPRMFDAFEQGGRDTTRQFGGLGLGLAIAKGLLDMHGGRITAHSAGRNQGATFTIELPLSTEEPAADKPAGAQRPMTDSGGARLLLVEDHADTVMIMSRILGRLGYQVEKAGSVAAATALIDQQRFDLLISDLGLPDGSGVEVMRHLRQRGHSTPGIALSGYGSREDVQRSKEAGFSEHLTKPVDLKRLAAVLEDLGRR